MSSKDSIDSQAAEEKTVRGETCLDVLFRGNYECLPFDRINWFRWLVNKGNSFSKISKPAERDGSFDVSSIWHSTDISGFFTKFFFELQYFGPDLRLTRAKTAIPIRSVQNADCFFVWFVITCHLTSYRASRDRFSAIIFDDYLHYCGMFLACFLIPIVLKPSYSLLTLRASWLVWYLYRIYQLNKSRCRCRCRCKWDVTI